jgi:hypothetical protein
VELRDLIVTPLLLIIIYIIAYYLRPRLTDHVTRKYFFPALTIRIFGALALGFIYQFYYGGGDTFKYHTYGSRAILNVFFKSPEDFFNLLLWGDGTESFNKFYRAIPALRDSSAFFTSRITLFLDLFTFSTYSGTAILFAFVSFLCMWRLFKTFYKEYKHLSKWLALATLFIPSVFFWGSGILKDTITLASLALATSLIIDLFRDRKISFGKLIGIGLSFYVIFSIKKYILLCFVPSILLWMLLFKLTEFKSMVFRIMLVPFALTAIIFSGYYSVVKLGEGDEKYEVGKLVKTAQITAYDIRYQTGRDAGSGYELPELDGSFQTLVRIIPQAVNVSLFRPYLWEVKNPLMLLSSVESFILLIFTLYILWRAKGRIFFLIMRPDILFCLVFSISFAFAVGASTFNFGTLARYKIPLLPFYSLGLILIFDQLKRDRNVSEFEATE